MSVWHFFLMLLLHAIRFQRLLLSIDIAHHILDSQTLQYRSCLDYTRVLVPPMVSPLTAIWKRAFGLHIHTHEHRTRKHELHSLCGYWDMGLALNVRGVTSYFPSPIDSKATGVRLLLTLLLRLVRTVLKVLREITRVHYREGATLVSRFRWMPVSQWKYTKHANREGHNHTNETTPPLAEGTRFSSRGKKASTHGDKKQ